MGVFHIWKSFQVCSEKIEVIQAQALRVCSRAYKTTPVSALHVEMGELPLQLRRKQLMMNYWINLQGQSVNKNPGIKLLSQVGNMGKTKPFLFGWDSMEVAKEMGLNNTLFNETVPLAVTPP